MTRPFVSLVLFTLMVLAVGCADPIPSDGDADADADGDGDSDGDADADSDGDGDGDADGDGDGDGDADGDGDGDGDADADGDGDGDGDADADGDGDADSDGDGDGDVDGDADVCTDADGDGYCVDEDCDDSAETGRTCHSGCLTFYPDTDGDGHGDGSITIRACLPPAGTVRSGDDCAVDDDSHWSDCGECVDADGDGYGPGCDLGEDCDDDPTTGASCFDGCLELYEDADHDGHGRPGTSFTACMAGPDDATVGDDCDDSPITGSTCFEGCSSFSPDADEDGRPATSVVEACVAPEGYFAGPGDDCDDADSRHWSDCLTCVDADDDGYGAGCDLGPDCDDGVESGGACHEGCGTFYPDGDEDGFGDAESSVERCAAPAGYITTGGDCDDGAAAAHPGGVELCGDGLDNDCVDGDQACPEPGDLLITEIMSNPRALADADGEWVEIFNATPDPIDLRGLVLHDLDLDLHVIGASVVVEPLGFVVLGRTAAAAPTVDYVYDDFILANDADEVLLSTFGTDGSDGEEIAGIRYDDGATFPDPNGASMSLDPDAFSLPAAEDGVSWCEAFSLFGAGDLGTPRGPNDECLAVPLVASVEPSECLDVGGCVVTIRGMGFADTTQVLFGGSPAGYVVLSDTEIEATAPAGSAGWVDVAVSNDRYADALASSFLYTGESTDIAWCNVQWPHSLTTAVGVATEPVFGQVLVNGVTEPPGQGAGVRGQVGFGPSGTSPATTIEWSWVEAAYNVDVGNNDEYQATLVPGEEGVFAYAYRFTVDDGVTWLYCDGAGSTVDSPYDVSNEYLMTVGP